MREAVIGEKAGWRGARREDVPGGPLTDEQRSQTAFSPITLRAAGLLAWGLVVACVTARCRGMARAARTSARSASPQSQIPSRSTSRHFQTGSKETLKNDLNHEWTRMNTNGNRLLAQVIRVHSRSFVVKPVLP